LFVLRRLRVPADGMPGKMDESLGVALVAARGAWISAPVAAASAEVEVNNPPQSIAAEANVVVAPRRYLFVM
jgi:hypothetical protein